MVAPRGHTPGLRRGQTPGLIALLTLCFSPAYGGLQLRPGMTGVADLGAISCETYNAMYPNGPTGLRQATLYYAEGYLYARTGQGIDALLDSQDKDWSFDALTDVVVDYCAANPAASVHDAIAELAAAIGVSDR